MAASSLFSPVLPYTKFSSSTLRFTNSKNSIFALSCSSPKSIPVTEKEVLQAIADSDGKNLPCVRTYDNDLSQLTLVGTVDFNQALTAAAADGGEVASDHIDAGLDAMVVETVFPAPSSDHATVSTRLFLPARKVKEKATKLRKSFPKDAFSGSASKNVLAMTFRQVVLQQIWSFDLTVFQPGEERKMDDLETPREVHASFALSSSDEYLISVLAEAICISALQSTQIQFLDKAKGGNRGGFFRWFQKPESVQSKDSAIILSKLFEDEIVENARSLLDNYNLMKDGFKPVKIKSGHHWWKPSCYEKLEKIGGSDFSAWASEYVPAYRLEIDTKIVGDSKIEGWKKSAENRWEVLLTHSQMVQLAETLDIYYVDPYSLPYKQLSCGVAAKFANVYNKKGNSFPKLLSFALASGIFLVAISALGQFCLPWLCKERKHSVEHRSLPSSEVNVAMNDFFDTKKLEECCVLAIAKVKDTFGWLGEIKVEDGIGVWIGELPAYLRGEGVDTLSTSENIDADAKVPIQDIASYQVVFSSERKIVGFQPLSRVAVNHWAANPLARELYRGKKLSPSLIEPGLKVPLPEKVIVVELLMSINPDAYFALARRFR
ncbi:hypothetical protein AAZX31_13G135600 [Glycine max]|uniref:Uncharacterized protein n=2 Tax=Glycine subgen. Soja TaxID=1462606 RepID=I1LZH4_SOYBN|nr:uncharacterized protein LOC100785118 [Glycine max]XP_028197585.1 uncharacterized protein LOC114382398 [Glycine soja]KAG4383757.1 hypothetical protein GLYMA_13G152304v4 [Glycine max]KAG4959635.1 hypothetical protein JHK87_036268 [Glycine soja]KAG4970660.1 hypothetical protein JHK85_037081 [Glycine max]KAG4977063.1 hypothetical protein JHK86_036537 [Glycine max]KAG5113083.1 hypothetical protein JHK82_036352 [Glycine max]|eukprot:XP_003541453.1 uncharacterized protein LOC100785118 [Glycine max]